MSDESDDKTEAPTPHRLEKAREEGQIPRSRELTSLLILLVGVSVIWFGGVSLARRLSGMLSAGLHFDHSIINDPNLILGQIILLIREAMLALLPLISGVVLVAIISPVMLGGLVFSGKSLQPKFSKMSPVSGFKRIFSVNSVVELIKSLLKIGLIVYICYNYLKNKWPLLYQLYDLDLMQAIGLIGNTVTDLGIRISLIYMIIAAADFIYQKVKFSRDMRMTKQEVKEEYKQQEGDPQIKGRIRQRMREASQRRMMQNLPQADVVITNPTHYAVAIKYDPEVADAPIVIAKGEDYLAAKIKEIARDHQIEIVENKPLARMLYANVDVGQAVPPELYQAVAEVLAFVYHLQGKI